MLKGHGDDIHNYKREIVSNFSSNIYGKQDLSALQQHLCSNIGLIHSYPEPDASSLTRLLAEKHCIGNENICVTNGATEAIYLIAQTFTNRNSSIVVPTFSEYEDACTIHNHTLSFIQHPDEIDNEAELVWICNPNNPDGTAYDLDYLTGIVKKHSDTIFLFDQSYGHFTDRQVWDIEEATQYTNVILIHSMTKQYCVPGLRLGYITGHSELIRQISERRMPWSVNGLATEAGKFLIGNEVRLPDIHAYLRETKRLQKKLSELPGITVSPTCTHFFLCRLEKKEAADLKSWLIDNYGILIRNAANFRGLDAHHFRIAAQSPEENEVLLKAIREWI